MVPRIPIILAFLAGVFLLSPTSGRAADLAVVFLYHRFGELAYPTTSVGLDQFDAQLAELKSGGYSVMPVPNIVRALREGKSLPDRTVGLSVDDAYASIATQAWPRLKAAGLPLTIFVATDPIDRGYRDYLSWDQIRALVKDGVTIGAHTASHLHMIEASGQTIAGEIERSNARFKVELGFVPEIFAYPYGEASLAVRDAVKSAGYVAAFGQHSGVIYGGSDFFNLPRFAINEHYGAIAEFRQRARALPLPVHDLLPADPLVTVNPPTIAFTVDEPDLRELTCFTSESGGVPVTRLSNNRVEIRLKEPMPPGRFRLNCTLPEDRGRFRWFGTPYYVPRPAAPR